MALWDVKASVAILLGMKLSGFCLECGRPGFDPWVGKIPWELPRVPLRGEGSCGGGGAPRDSAGSLWT